MSYSIYHDFVIKAPIHKIYEAITDPDKLINWWPRKCEGKPIEGEVYNLYFTPDYNWYGKVIKSATNQSFHIKMTKSDADWDPTTFGFDLKENEDHVQVSFWHVGWPECNAHYKRSSYCWAILLNGLKNYLEKGIIVPFAERE